MKVLPNAVYDGVAAIRFQRTTITVHEMSAINSN